ncbi:MAG TPA: DUF1559 domain-containing protein [Rariglobus sp.]
MKNHPRSSRRAFTLTEILTVLGILGILIALLLPMIGKARASARLSACNSNLRQVGIALLSYAGDHRQVLPATITPDDRAHPNATYLRPWSQVLIDQGFITDPTIYKCPADTVNTLTTGTRSYAYCEPAMSNGVGGAVPRPTLLTAVKEPARQYMLTEWHDDGNAYYLTSWSGAHEDIIGPNSVSPTHADGGRYFLFMDGHVEWRTQERAADRHSGWVLNDIRS